MDRYPAVESNFRSSAASREDLLLSAIEIEISTDRFRAAVTSYVGEDSFTALSKRQDAFVYRRKSAPPEEQVYVVPLTAESLTSLSNPKELACKHHLRLLASLVEHRLPELLPKLALRRMKFGLDRVRTADDLISISLRRAGLERPVKLAPFHKYFRTRLSVRQEFMPGRGPFLALTIDFRREFEIEGTAADLLELGYHLNGVSLLSTESNAGWLGCVVGREGARLVVAGDQGTVTVEPSHCRIEPSTQAFSLLLPQVLGAHGTKRYERAEWAVQADQLSGEGYLQRLSNTAKYFSEQGPLRVTPELTIRFGSILSAPFSGREPCAVALPEIEYCFSADRTAINSIPFRGLDLHGPFDNRRFDRKEPRILIACPGDARNDADQFMRRFLEGMAKDGKERFARGFVATYRLSRIIPQFLSVALPQPGSSQTGEHYVRALAQAFDPSRRPDLVFVFVRDEDAFIEVGNPYLAAKAFLLAQGIPSQEVRLSKVRSTIGNLPYILEDIAVASYAKMGGAPWTLMPTLPLTKEIVLGMAHAEFGGRSSARTRYMGITTVFTNDGTYLLAASSPRCRYEEYPEVLATSVKDILSRLVTEHNWGEGDIVRLVFHASKPLTKNEVSTVARLAIRELGAKVQFEAAFLTVMKDHPFKVIAPDALGRKGLVELTSGGMGFAQVGRCVPDRGTVVNLGRSKRLVAVHGTVLAKREGEGIPQPLLIELHSASTYTDMSALARQVYHFTGLSWASMKPVVEPVTIHYARLIAKMLGRLDGHPNWSDHLLDTHLRRSRWFL